MEPLGEEKRNASPDGVVIASVVGSKSSRPENAIAVTSYRATRYRVSRRTLSLQTRMHSPRDQPQTNEFEDSHPVSRRNFG